MTPYLQSVLRITSAFVFFLHGTQKPLRVSLGLLRFQSGDADVVDQKPPAFSDALGCGALMALGLFTRPVALHPVGRDGRCLFQAACAAGALADL